jgi:uncharacterized protein
MKAIGIAGGSGFIGSALTSLLVNKGYEVVIFTRNKRAKSREPAISYCHWDAENEIYNGKFLKKLYAMVNLAGAGIADKRWKKKRKQEISGSRIKGTDFLIAELKAHAPLCKTFLSASAIGFYGPDMGLHTPFTETASHYDDFLGNICMQWEQSAQKGQEFARTVILRFGIVLGKESGAFAQLAKPMSFGIMPTLGSGGQAVSWIEITDLARLILFALEHEEMQGIYNAVAPCPVTHHELMKTIATGMGGIKIPVHVPSVLLKILLGEMSTEVLKSCTVSAQKIMDAGFTFNHTDITSAIKAILGKD